MILKGINSVDFPRRIGKNAQQIIKKLCRYYRFFRLNAFAEL